MALVGGQYPIITGFFWSSCIVTGVLSFENSYNNAKKTGAL
jgi:hypothetical protein